MKCKRSPRFRAAWKSVWPALRVGILVGMVAAGCIGVVEPQIGDGVATDSEPAKEADTSSETDTSSEIDTSEEADTGPIREVVISVDPVVTTILHVNWTQFEAAESSWVEFSFENDEWHATPTGSGEMGAQEALILGVPATTEVQVRIMNQVDGVTSSDEKTHLATTGDLPSGLREITLHSLDTDLASSEGYLMGTVSRDSGSGGYGSTMWVFIIDRQGRYVWFYEVPGSRLSLYAQVAHDGAHILFDGTTHYVWTGGVQPTIWKATLDLKTLEELELTALGFAFDEIDDGLLLYDHEEGDHTLVERSPEGEEREIWNCTAYLRDIGTAAWTCPPNSLVWLPQTDSIFWSMYNNDTVVEIDRQTGEVLRQFGQLQGGYAFDPPESVVDYQHYPSLTPEGNIIVSTHTLGGGPQRASEWVVDDTTETLTEVWRYDGAPYYASYGGEAYRLDNGNTLIGFGTGGALQEVTEDKQVAWDISWQGGPLLGHVTLLDDLYALSQGGVTQGSK